MADIAHDDLAGRPTVQAKDEDRLAEIGYKQELQRNWSLLHNFGVSFSIIVGIPIYLIGAREASPKSTRQSNDDLTAL